MSFTWDEICKEWITQNCEDYNKSELTDAFGILEKEFGRVWLETKYKFIRGPIVIVSILELSRIIKALETNPKYKIIINKLRKGEELDLARLAAFYSLREYKVVIEPKIQVNGKTKVPDLKVKFDNKWVFFEAYTPSASDHNKILSRKAHKTAAGIVENISEGIDFKVYFIREPDNIELNPFIHACAQLGEIVENQKIYSYKDLAKMVVKPLENDTTIDNGRYLADGVRRFFYIWGSIRDKAIQKKCLVGMPFVDKRADRILRNQYPQLSRNECNVISIDLTNITGDYDLWVERLKSRLRGNIYRRIGAVLMTSYMKNTPEKNYRLLQEIIIHPNPLKPLPKEFFQITEKGILV